MAEQKCPELNKNFSADCPLEFRLSTNLSGTDTTTSPFTLATVSNKLELCSSTVVFEDLPCRENLKNVILGIPLVFVDDCNMHKIDLTKLAISPDADYTSNIVVKELNTSNPLAIDLQVANGYLYVIICVENYVEDTPLSLCFDVFCFDLIKKIIPCNCTIKCKQVTWSYGYGLECPPPTTIAV